MSKQNNIQGIKARFVIHEILYAIKYKNRSFEEIFEEKKNKENLKLSDLKLIHDVVLNSMRLSLFINKIIKLYSKKKPKKNQYILLLSGITQLIYLNYKNYAVINCSVEIAKYKKINAIPSYINGILKKIDTNKENLKKIKLDKKILGELHNNKIFSNLKHLDKINIFTSVSQKPNLHLVFKSEAALDKSKTNINKTSRSSGTIIDQIPITKINEFKNGLCWAQDFSAMLPLHMTKNLKNLKVLDLCAAPGGKTFQLIKEGANVLSVEKNKERANLLKENLKRLKYSSKIKVIDALKLEERIKYDIVIVDAPCSSVGTMRRNPDIIFKEKIINLDKKIELQRNMLKKADKLLLKNGYIIYIVCSFLFKETYSQVYNFLNSNKNYEIEKFNAESKYASLVDKNGFINIVPQKFDNILIDGFFAAKLKKLN